MSKHNIRLWCHKYNEKKKMHKKIKETEMNNIPIVVPSTTKECATHSTVFNNSPSSLPDSIKRKEKKTHTHNFKVLNFTYPC